VYVPPISVGEIGNSEGVGTVQQISAEAMREVESARVRYEEEVKAAGLARSTEDTYLLVNVHNIRA
jgi:hypothetical protein